MGRPSRGVKPVNYAQYDRGASFDDDEDSEQERDASMLDSDSDDDSEGSNYDAKEGQDAMEEDDNYDDSDLDSDQREMNDIAFSSDDDDLLNTPNSKSKRRKGNPNPMKRKREMPKEPEELLKRGAALAHVAEALLKEQRASDSGRLVNKAEYVTLPDLKTPEQFNAFGNQIIAQVDGLGTATGDFNLHPFLSFISSPWEERPNFHKRQDAAKNPIRSPWRKTYPSAAQKDADKKANGGVDRPILQYRHEALDADKYGVVRDVTFLPNPVPLATPSWKLALYTTLGATPDDIAHRVSTTDPDLNDRVVSHQQLRNNIKKKVDDWSKLYHGGFQWLGDRQKSRARKDNSEEPEQESRKGKGKSKARKRKSRARKASGEAQEQKSRKGKDDGEAKDGNGAKEGSEAKEKELGHEFARAVLAGWGDRRQAVSDLGYYFNTTWEVDIKLGVMRQPNSTGTPYPLWAPRKREKIPSLLLEWRKEIAKLPELPNLQDLVDDYAGEILLEDGNFEVEQGISGVETGLEDEQAKPVSETGLEEDTLPEDDRQMDGSADGSGSPPPFAEKHTMSSSPDIEPKERKRRKL